VTEPSLRETIQRILARETRALARAATWIENRRPEAEALLKELAPQAGRALVLGVTGAPGTGKSTLCNALIRELRVQGKTVAIVAVDPSSPYTGGALLGDRIRMQQHHEDPGVFIRSMATRGLTGGVARTTKEIALLLDAAGFDVVIIETVGVGQGEVEIARLAGVTLLVLAPGSGDEVQASKAGIMEIAQVLVINKADLPGAGKLEHELKASLSLSHGDEGWNPTIIQTVASEGQGVGGLLRAAEECRARQKDSHRLAGGALPGGAAIDHLGIAVKSIEQALGFYERQLGLKVALRETVGQEKVNVAMLPLEGSRIELLEPTEAESPVGKFLAKHGEGLHHVALKVPDLNAAVERLRAAGAKLLNEPRAGAGGHLYVFVHPASTGGVLLELIQA
jgi:LAO/AO transport system kinase